MDTKKSGKTGLVYDLRMVDHRCLWNDEYPECPERFTGILARCNELNLIERCQPIPSRPATLNEILLKHTQEHYDLLRATHGETDVQKLEEMCTHYDIFIHPVNNLLSPLRQRLNYHGMAVIRPPGHHAMHTRFDGFCFFNNVAIAAQHASNNHNVNRILVVDFDVHHGQGTQQLFYDDPRVLYFSIHRFDHATFFPGLRESDFDYVGKGSGEGFNFNVALNKSGMTNADYLAIWQQILLPVAVEYQPELVLISAGYDAAYGCALGEMEITPACYAHLISPLMTLAEGKVAAFLEGGYNLESLAESAAITLKTFLGDPCPLLEMLDEPSDSVRDSILNCIQSHKAFWKCLQIHKEYSPEAALDVEDQSRFHQVIQKFIDDIELNPWHECDYYDTQLLFPNQTRSEEDEMKISEHLQYLKRVTNLGQPLNRTCFVSSDKTEQFLLKHNLLERLHGLEVYHNVSTTLNLPSMLKSSDPNTFQSSAIALALLSNVLEDKYRNGIYFEFRENGVSSLQTSIRDNVALAVQCTSEFQGLKRVMVVDFGGNGLQDIVTQTNCNQNILYVSLDYGDTQNISNSYKTTVNIPLNKQIAGDFDYVTVFQRIIMPIAYEFNPELVLVSADFDKIGAGHLSSDTFCHLILWMSALANGKIIVFLKDDCKAIATYIKTLLGDPLAMLKLKRGGDETINNIGIIQSAISVQEHNWKSLKFNKMLPILK